MTKYIIFYSSKMWSNSLIQFSAAKAPVEILSLVLNTRFQQLLKVGGKEEGEKKVPPKNPAQELDIWATQKGC